MPTFKVRRLSQKARDRIVRGLRRSWQPGGTHDRLFRHRETDADTLRSRALWDRKGTPFADIRLPDGRLFRCYWSTLGRTDQVDVYFDGARIATCAPNRIFKEIT